jgi:hypothetical protein
MNRGWTSGHLPVADDDENLWTVAEAAARLGHLPTDRDTTPPHMTVTKLRDLARYHLTAVGKRRTTSPGRPGRYARVYRATDFIALYEHMDPDNEEKPPAAA